MSDDRSESEVDAETPDNEAAAVARAAGEEAVGESAGGGGSEVAGEDVVGEGERYRSVVAELREDLAGVELALERLDEGTYGTCRVCGEPIPEEELEAVPVAALCAAHRPADTA